MNKRRTSPKEYPKGYKAKGGRKAACVRRLKTKTGEAGWSEKKTKNQEDHTGRDAQ